MLSQNKKMGELSLPFMQGYSFKVFMAMAQVVLQVT